ncbi:MAG: hypothetical protein MUO21_00920 [Nitrososphaeraceae archaeon]|nr:hypothetical protein [Nitrososphaeraceae archaeon]
MSLYSVTTKLRSKKLENLPCINDVCMYDQHDIVFQSFSKDKAIEYFNSINKLDNANWRTISKEVIITPLDKDCGEGFINEEAIISKYW